MANGLEMMLSTEVELLQAENARLNNEVVKLREELALSRDLRRSQAQVNGDLSEQLAKEQNKLEMAEAVIAGDGALITGLKNELAAAQATIEQMREKSEAAKNACMVASSGCSHIKTHAECNEARQFAHATKINVETSLSALNEALSVPPNLDALHETLAKECERLAKTHGVGVMKWLCEEAATHRARKENSHE